MLLDLFGEAIVKDNLSHLALKKFYWSHYEASSKQGAI